MMTEPERLELLIRVLEGNNASEFARKIGIETSAVSRIRAGQYGIKKKINSIIKAYPAVNRDWLETGEGYPGDISVDFVKSYYERKLKRQEKIIDYLISRINDLENSSETIL